MSFAPTGPPTGPPTSEMGPSCSLFDKFVHVGTAMKMNKSMPPGHCSTPQPNRAPPEPSSRTAQNGAKGAARGQKSTVSWSGRDLTSGPWRNDCGGSPFAPDTFFLWRNASEVVDLRRVIGEVRTLDTGGMSEGAALTRGGVPNWSHKLPDRVCSGVLGGQEL